MRRTGSGALGGLGALALIVTPVLGQPTGDPCWCESGDAGSSLGTAQTTEGLPTGGARPLECIRGTLSTTSPAEPDFEDLYLIRLCAPLPMFVARTNVEGTSTAFDTELFLFRSNGRGRVANDNIDTAKGEIRSRINAFPAEGPPISTPGLYYLGITGRPRMPVSATGAIFEFQGPDQISGPDGPGGDDPLAGWVVPPMTPLGAYEIRLRSVTFADGSADDCNMNGIADACDIAFGPSVDENLDGIPDECQCREDIDGSGAVDTGDLILLLAAWGPCDPGECPQDINFDREVDTADLILLIGAWGPCALP